MKLQSVDDLFTQGLQYVYDAEKQLLEAMPQMLQASSDPELKQVLEQHLSETKEQVSRAEQVFQICGKQPETKPNTVVKAMQQEVQQMISQTEQGPVRDAALIVAGNQIEHYEIAAYGSLRTYAQLLGKNDIVSLLEKTLQEEKQADAKLTQVGEQKVNVQAVHSSAASAGAR